MHICLPDTREVRPPHGSSYMLYNVHVDGLYHCSLRYKQLLHLHQALSKKFTGPFNQLPSFPPKKLLPLSLNQVEERRIQLEKYLQNITQDKAISNSSIFNLFLLEAQRESTRIRDGQVNLDIELVNGQKIRLQILTHDSADAVLTSVCRALGLNDRYHAYFCLCLCGYDVVRDKLIIKRRLSFFESPYITLQMAIQQQEQLQNVLANSNSSYTPSPSSSLCNGSNGSSNISYNNNNINNNNCRCLSCSPQQLNNSTTITTNVPLVGSSGDSSFRNQTATTNNYQYQYQTVCYQANNMNGTSNNTNNNRQSIESKSTFKTKSTTFVTHRILLRKSYWDPIYDTYILNDQQALNLLFIQTVYDIKHSLMFVDRETYHQLESLLASESKLEYILLARTLKYYNYVHFEPCISDYPRPKTKVMISIGSKELNMRVLKSRRSYHNSLVEQQQQQQQQQHQSSNNSIESDQHILYCTSSLVPSGYHHLITKEDIVEEEYNFKVPLIRCWRLTSLETLNSNNTNIVTRTNQSTGTSVRRRSLSLFNSVVGNVTNRNNSTNNNNNNSSNNLTNENNRQSEFHQRALNRSGTGGNSLLAALAGNQSNGTTPMTTNTTTAPTNTTSDENLNQNYLDDDDRTQFSQYELSFEYLISKDKLKWITISSDQAIFISISLQGVVDELVSKRDSRSSLYKGIDQTTATTNPTQLIPGSPTLATASANNRHHRQQQQQQQQLTTNNGYGSSVTTSNQSFTYLYRDGSQKLLNTSNQQLIDKFGTTLGYSPTNPYTLAVARHRTQQTRASIPANSFQASSSSFCVASSSSSSGGWFPDVSGFGNVNGQSGSNNNYHSNNGNGSFEILNIIKKAPCPIINDAFEGVTNDDDL